MCLAGVAWRVKLKRLLGKTWETSSGLSPHFHSPFQVFQSQLPLGRCPSCSIDGGLIKGRVSGAQCSFIFFFYSSLGILSSKSLLGGHSVVAPTMWPCWLTSRAFQYLLHWVLQRNLGSVGKRMKKQVERGQGAVGIPSWLQHPVPTLYVFTKIRNRLPSRYTYVYLYACISHVHTCMYYTCVHIQCFLVCV